VRGRDERVIFISVGVLVSVLEFWVARTLRTLKANDIGAELVEDCVARLECVLLPKSCIITEK
jgi:hypothetical protein